MSFSVFRTAFGLMVEAVRIALTLMVPYLRPLGCDGHHIFAHFRAAADRVSWPALSAPAQWQSRASHAVGWRAAGFCASTAPATPPPPSARRSPPRARPLP